MLTTNEKRRILLNSIFGVDIDPQAVEVTKLSLLLKVLEGESDETLDQQRRIFRERALPDLESNIKCGNSLIGPDYYDLDGSELIEHKDRQSINAFEWNIAFPWLEEAAGFDSVIGNPPYGKDLLTRFKNYFEVRYESSQYKLDSFAFFLEKGLRLLRNGGKLGFIVPNTLIDTHTFSKVRKLIATGSAIRLAVNLGKQVFADANIDTMILVLEKAEPDEIRVIDASDHTKGVLRIATPYREFAVQQSVWCADPQFPFNIHSNSEESSTFERMRSNGVNLGELIDCSQGLIPYATKEESQRNPYLSSVECEGWKPLLDKGACVGRYSLKWNGVYVHFGSWLYTANNPKFYENEKILIQRHRNPSLKRRIVATYDPGRYYYKDNLCGLIARPGCPDLRFILGLLNSELINEF